MAAIDTFFTDVDPGRRIPIESILPKPELEKFIASYEGIESKEARLRALAALLASKATELQRRDPQPPSARSEQVDYEDIQALIYAEINDWPAASAIWGQIVETYYPHAKDDAPNRRRVSALWNFGCALRGTHRYAEAEVMFRRVLSIDGADPELGENSEEYARDLGAVMMAVGKQGRKDEARGYYEKHKAVISQLDEEKRTSLVRDIERDWASLEEPAEG